MANLSFGADRQLQEKTTYTAQDEQKRQMSVFFPRNGSTIITVKKSVRGREKRRNKYKVQITISAFLAFRQSSQWMLTTVKFCFSNYLSMNFVRPLSSAY